MENKTIYIFDHNENEEFTITGIEEFIEWLNNYDDNFSFSLSKFEFDKRSA